MRFSSSLFLYPIFQSASAGFLFSRLNLADFLHKLYNFFNNIRKNILNAKIYKSITKLKLFFLLKSDSITMYHLHLIQPPLVGGYSSVKTKTGKELPLT